MQRGTSASARPRSGPTGHASTRRAPCSLSTARLSTPSSTSTAISVCSANTTSICSARSTWPPKPRLPRARAATGAKAKAADWPIPAGWSSSPWAVSRVRAMPSRATSNASLPPRFSWPGHTATTTAPCGHKAPTAICSSSTRPATCRPTLSTSFSNTRGLPSIPISWAACAPRRPSSNRAKAWSNISSPAWGSTCRPVTCSALTGKLPYATRQSCPTARYAPMPTTAPTTSRPWG